MAALSLRLSADYLPSKSLLLLLIDRKTESKRADNSIEQQASGSSGAEIELFDYLYSSKIADRTKKRVKNNKMMRSFSHAILRRIIFIDYNIYGGTIWKSDNTDVNKKGGC